MHSSARLLVGLSVLMLPQVAQATERTIYLAGQLTDSCMIRLGTAVATRPDAVLLVDSSDLSPYLRHFLAEYRPGKVIPIGTFAETQAALTKRLGVQVEPIIPWSKDPAGVVPRATGLHQQAKTVVVSPLTPRETLLRAACLAGSLNAPLWLSHDYDHEEKMLQAFLKQCGAREVILTGRRVRAEVNLSGVSVSRAATRRELDSATYSALGRNSRIETVVVVNPADGEGKNSGEDKGGMSTLAPWLATLKRAALLTTSEDGKDAAQVVEKAGKEKALRNLENVIFLGTHKAIPVWKRPNPIPKDKDPVIEMEPLTPKGQNAFSYSVGRLFHADRAVVPLMLARQKLAAENTAPRKTLVASNPGGGLSLLETFSRHTASEMRNAGHKVTLLAGDDLDARILRKSMPGHDYILWEGHHNTLIFNWGFANWDEPMNPTFVCLQSCLALEDWKVAKLFSRGAYAIVGTSTRTYSGSGGAFSLSYFNGLLHDNQTLGGSLRQAKNFLLAYAALKEKRLADQATRTGANYRAAWAFSLWGDPTYLPTKPDTQRQNLTGVRHTVTGNSLVLDLPNNRLNKLKTDRYTTHVPANARLAGLVRKGSQDDPRALVPMVFAEVHLPRARPGITPRLKSRLPSSNWVFLWDSRRKTGYLLALPRDLDAGELRFRIDWPAMSVASDMEDTNSGS